MNIIKWQELGFGLEKQIGPVFFNTKRKIKSEIFQPPNKTQHKYYFV